MTVEIIIFIVITIMLSALLFGLGAIFGYRMAEDRMPRPRQRYDNRRITSVRQAKKRAEHEIVHLNNAADDAMEAMERAVFRHRRNNRRNVGR